MAPLEKPIQEATIGGGEKTVDDIGIMLTVATAAGVTAHALFSALRHGGSDKKDETPHKE
jgi:quinone-reactive Ni/Fe-hydrogenase small subunit/[NiFe] hydrogenase small subunit